MSHAMSFHCSFAKIQPFETAGIKERPQKGALSLVTEIPEVKKNIERVYIQFYSKVRKNIERVQIQFYCEVRSPEKRCVKILCKYCKYHLDRSVSRVRARECLRKYFQ